MNHLILIMALLLPGLSYASEVGNGGDVVDCTDDVTNKKRIYFLDSAFSKHERPEYIKIYKTSDEFLTLFRDKLASTFPFLERDFAGFLEIYKTKGNSKKGWRRGFPLDLKDENLFTEFPENCFPDTAKQAIIRHQEVGNYKGADHIISTDYFYNEKIISELSKTQDELSWALVHEWLWDHLPNAFRIRKINEYFHSHEFLNASTEEIRTTIREYGFDGADLTSLSSLMDSKKHYDLIRNNVSKIIRTLDFHESFLIDLFDANQKDKIPAREVELYYINLVTYYAYIEPAMLNFYDEGRHGWGRSKKMITSENYQKILKTTLTSYKEDKRKYLNGADLSSLAKFYGEGSVYQIDYDANIAFQEKRADYYTSKISPLQDYFTDNFNFRNPIKKKTSEEVLEDGSLGDWDTD